MDSEYDRKFEEMKKYIPFLENMITRLESTSASSSNPRQAQLDKIRSLRDLLLNKKKRMKMENLLKCEQVLVNLYAKVEQRDTLSGIKKTEDSSFSIDSPTPKEKSDLEAVRSKLKTVAKRQESMQDTLPEILTRSEVNDVHTSGSKEPALFQRRPNHQPIQSTTEENNTSTTSSSVKRNYTRVLVSPDTSSRRWSPSQASGEKPLFSRRSPRKSPRRHSPSYYKKERKKSRESHRKDLNITLNVPEESLQSLNTKDILSRIINCSDGDVDIDTLRELRKQILTELQKTGAKDDISDLILKSYNKNKTKTSKPKVKEEIEEGELSDSESEAIESIYGSLVVKDPIQTKVSSDKITQPRKIQICLVINSDDKPDTTPEPSKQDVTTDFAELVMYDKETKEKHCNADVSLLKDQEVTIDKPKEKSEIEEENPDGQKMPPDENTTSPTEGTVSPQQSKISCNAVVNSISIDKNDATVPQESVQFKANFYKPLVEPNNLESVEPSQTEVTNNKETSDIQTTEKIGSSNVDNTLGKAEKSPEIPLLHDRTIEKKPPENTLSEIDILQALKKEILSDITMPGTETSTPLLHQPKVIKVASAQEILPKKRISIENYKQKSATSSKSILDEIASKDDLMKKPSLKLTEKECERFNIPKISFDDEDESLDDEDDGDIQAEDVYSDLAPKSPDDNESLIHNKSTPPVIIPVEPIKSTPVLMHHTKTDVDMRTLPILSPNLSKIPVNYNNVATPPKNELCVDKKINDKIDQNPNLTRPTLTDPRVRRDLNTNISSQSPNPHVVNPDRTPRPNVFSNIILSGSTPNPLMTPNARAYEMTPTRQSFEIDQPSQASKHVYVPTLAGYDYREREKSVSRDSSAGDRRSDVRESSWNSSKDNLTQNTRSMNDKFNNGPIHDRFNPDKREDSYYRSDVPIITVTSPQHFARLEAPTTYLSYGRSDCPTTPSHPFGRLDCPPTPTHPFGRLECPPTPSHHFGRTDCPPTPTHPFGRVDCPSTPSHPFGRSDCPPTSIHPFGRSECPPTPSHSFGRSECPSTPSHQFGRSEGPSSAIPSLMDCNLFGGTDCSSTPTSFGRNDFAPNTNNTFVNTDCGTTQKANRSIESPQTPSHSFGRRDPNKNPYSNRSDLNISKYTKDPRLYRKPDPESNSQYDERDRGYYKERDRYCSSSYSSQKSHSGSDTYYDREIKTKKFNYVPPALRLNNKNRERDDRSVGRFVTKDYERDSYRERKFNSDARSHEEVGSRRLRSEDPRFSSGSSKSSRNIVKELEPNTLSVKSNAGRSFTIDTSINTTFQKHIDRAKDIISPVNNFEARRERAASVGRSLTRESSVGRGLCNKSQNYSYENKREAFRRASSVGREIINADKRSFQEIKADFKSCKLSAKEFSKEHELQNTKSAAGSIGRSRRDSYESQRSERRGQESSKSCYSPRKNYRDPRMRRQLETKSDRRANETYGRKSGIVYSNDNIVTGSIMASGYGVRNYKIPKIKRATEEKEVPVANTELDKNDEKEKVSKHVNDKEKVNYKEQFISKNNNKDLKKKQTDHTGTMSSDESKKVTDEEQNIEKRQTRSIRKSNIQSKSDTNTKTKKAKKLFVYDSDSDDDLKNKDRNSKDANEKVITGVDDSNTNKSTKPLSPTKAEKTNRDSVQLDTSFGMEELEMFPDNIVSDPIIDNINDLIADLDNDLSAGKSDTSHNFTKEITLENMMENISSPQIHEDDSANIIDAIDNITNDKTKVSSENKINHTPILESAATNVVSNVLTKNLENDQLQTNQNIKIQPSDPTTGSTPTQSDATECNRDESSCLSSTSALRSNNEDIDSTTESKQHNNLANDTLAVVTQNTDACSTPDSTINTDEALLKSSGEDSLPGCSTNEVTSTESIDTKPCPEPKESVAGLDSLGSLLSILQDKSKIKELLSMLGDHSSENEKIKKKLEKLSEIVSDDEETTEDVPIIETKEKKEKISETSMNDKEDKITKGDLLSQDCNDFDGTGSKEENLNTRDDSKLQNVDAKDSDIDADAQEIDTEIQNNDIKSKKKPMKKTKGFKKSKLKLKKTGPVAAKRVTRATTATKPKVKKPPRELMQLQEDIKEMFIRDEVLSATGLRMCRLAKLVDEKSSTPQLKDESVVSEAGPVVILEKFKDAIDKPTGSEKLKKKKPGPKSKAYTQENARVKTPTPIKSKPGPKSKTKNKKDSDPYEFELDSVGDTTTEKASDDGSCSSSDSESDSLTSSKSFGSTEILADSKKKIKRKRRGWQAGVIKTKAKKKKMEPKQSDPVSVSFDDTEKTAVQDFSCFTDRSYCFRKNLLSYPCRLCPFSGADIVLHYRNQHPHVEIPLSRMAPEAAKDAIEQCEEINFEAVSKIPSDKYICTFCYKEFTNNKSVLETFFWHIVSMHTGEYKHNCSKCVNVNECPFKLDIPPPPKDIKGQLIGFICKKCNFTQISLENLKTHVIERHNDEQTAVYKINLSVMSKKSLSSLLRRSEEKQAILQTNIPSSSLPTEEKHINSIEKSDNEGVKTRKSARKSKSLTPIQSMLTFEGDDNASEFSDVISDTGEATVKIERNDSENADGISTNEECLPAETSEFHRPSEDVENKLIKQQQECPPPEEETQHSNDIVDYPHFKLNHTESGAKEYFCCINGNNHFKTTLLISMKKHVQSKHSEKWDGYCYICRVIVTPQGVHCFKDCLQHYLDRHMDSFPIIEENTQTPPVSSDASISKPYINVRPLSDLITNPDDSSPEQTSSFPIIQSVMSLGIPPVEPLQTSLPYSEVAQEQVVVKIVKYEEHQAEVISKKYYLVSPLMLTPENLVKLFKCSGRYCSFVTNSTEDALAHATTHQRIGGTGALDCCYCDFDSAGNAVDLVTHVFRNHGGCQFCCSQCFYRAASSQAVGSHMSKVHGTTPKPGSVLRSTATTTVAPLKTTILTREQAVPFYICGHSDREGACKFRVYTPDKFFDHLQQRHTSVQAHPCHACAVKFTAATELVQHMRCHGLQLYQCTWCVHGANNENDLLSHISSVHPDKQPQAYIRITTNKDGRADQRVLPLAFLNKYKVQFQDVTPSATSTHPVREAERAVEMESLIAPFMTETSTTVDNNETPMQTTDLPEDMIETQQDTKPPINIQVPVPPIETAQPPSTITPDVTPETIVPDIGVPKVKTEPVDSEKDAIPSVVVLDSDDEDSITVIPQRPVIDLSEEEAAQTSKEQKLTSKVFPDQLYKCPRCKQVCKNMGGLKKHIYSCSMGAPTGILKCPHCDYVGETLDHLMVHYEVEHGTRITYECGLCNRRFTTERNSIKHMKNVHKEKSDVTFTTIETNGSTHNIVNPMKKGLSEPGKDTSKPVAKKTVTKTRFDPQEIDLLPINPILNQEVYCSRCEFSTKVRLNMVRHLQLHAEQQPVPQTAPVNPVPHLESNEKHFDKMVNLASSSIVNRTPDKSRPEHVPAVTLLMPPEAASRYPKYVPERQRHTCGARGCSYISVDEAMLRCHWETLHSGTSDFHCVHCPPYQQLDTSKPLTAARIISHLKMHDATLFACSACSYYHFKREALEKHLSEVDKNGRLMIVREECTTPIASPATSAPSNPAPTMDLKPWQCGLCKFKSMLRPEVVDHCSKQHQSKMQYKCIYCPFRTSAIENISKHQSNSHAGKPEEVFYYYYREGSIPEETDGTPRWMKQRQKLNVSDPEVKMEEEVSPASKTCTPVVITPLNINLDLVKQEVEEVPRPVIANSIEDLCKLFGNFCDPNGIKFKCPLCTVVMEHTKDMMQSHLYEELNYRKWSCGLCSYKAFHKAGLTEHMTSEHRRQYEHVELPTDVNIERWVAAVLDHQAAIIDKYKTNMAKNKIVVDTPKPGPSTAPVVPIEPVQKYSEKDLETAFGVFWTPNNAMFCCAKCGFMSKDEVSMRDHLEMELNKIRWGCSNCSNHYQTYHEARFHCKSHDGPSRPVEAVRDPAMRAAWVATAIQKQRQIIQNITTPSSTEAPTPEKNFSDSDNSLLVVRYEERVPSDSVKVKRKRPPPESDDERLVIDEPSPKKKPETKCPYCDHRSIYHNNIKIHMLIHFNLKPYTCGYCKFNSYSKKGTEKHIQQTHPNKPIKIKMTELPTDAQKLSEYTCLECETLVPEKEIPNHLHDKIRPVITKLSTVVKCCICLNLYEDIQSFQKHHNTDHPGEPSVYEFYKLGVDTRDRYKCVYCETKFKHLMEYRAHHASTHSGLHLKITPLPTASEDRNQTGPVVHKRCARKSTTKLPNSVARKSTTKLPYSVPRSSLDEGYSYYGTKPTPLEEYSNVTTLMSFCNMMVPFSMKQLSEHLNIEPKVLVTDIKGPSD